MTVPVTIQPVVEWKLRDYLADQYLLEIATHSAEAQQKIDVWLNELHEVGVGQFLVMKNLTTNAATIAKDETLESFAIGLAQRVIVGAAGQDDMRADLERMRETTAEMHAVYANEACLLPSAARQERVLEQQELIEILTATPWLFVIYLGLVTGSFHVARTRLLTDH